MIRIIDGNIVENYSIAQLKQDNPNTSFPAKITSDILAEFNVYETVVGKIPEYDKYIQKVVISKEPTLVDDVWTYTYNIVTLTDDEVNEYKNNLEIQAKNRRNKLLLASDWTQVVDSPLTEIQKLEWAQYRQNLRDISDQPEFPINIVWPQTPK